jgi:hypothetical protein
MYATIEGSSRKGNMNNNSLPELKAFKRAPCLGLSQWENGNLTTNRAQLVLVSFPPSRGPWFLQKETFIIPPAMIAVSIRDRIPDFQRLNSTVS